MSAPSVPAGEADDPRGLSPSPFDASVLGPAEGTAPRLLLSDDAAHREAVLAYALALEHIRVASPSDLRVTARYCASVVDDSRLLAGCARSCICVC
jgi:hypothetical protein